MEALRELLVRHPLAICSTDEPPVYAVDASVWPRCDAECSPECGYYYHPYRHSSGQPIVAGWAYQFIARLGFIRDSWTAPVDVSRIRPEQEANSVATEQVESLLGGLEKVEAPSVRLRRRLRSCQVAKRAGGEPVPDPRPLALRTPLL